jgi:hypothetical protein
MMQGLSAVPSYWSLDRQGRLWEALRRRLDAQAAEPCDVCLRGSRPLGLASG